LYATIQYRNPIETLETPSQKIPKKRSFFDRKTARYLYYQNDKETTATQKAEKGN